MYKTFAKFYDPCKPVEGDVFKSTCSLYLNIVFQSKKKTKKGEIKINPF